MTLAIFLKYLALRAASTVFLPDLENFNNVCVHSAQLSSIGKRLFQSLIEVELSCLFFSLGLTYQIRGDFV